MKNIACCFFGDKILPETIENVCANLTVAGVQNALPFTYYNNDTFRSLRTVALIKRRYEIVNKIEFDVCIAIGKDIDNVVLPEVINENTVYYYKGDFVNGDTTLVDYTLFTAETLTFDRACEFATNMPNINMHWLNEPQRSLNGQFFYHLKSLMIRTKYIKL